MYFAGATEQFESLVCSDFQMKASSCWSLFCSSSVSFYIFKIVRKKKKVNHSLLIISLVRTSSRVRTQDSLVKHAKQLCQFLLRLPFAVVLHAPHHHDQELVKVHRATPCTNAMISLHHYTPHQIDLYILFNHQTSRVLLKGQIYEHLVKLFISCILYL